MWAMRHLQTLAIWSCCALIPADRLPLKKPGTEHAVDRSGINPADRAGYSGNGGDEGGNIIYNCSIRGVTAPGLNVFLDHQHRALISIRRLFSCIGSCFSEAMILKTFYFLIPISNFHL